jgi:hypothetical protein
VITSFFGSEDVAAVEKSHVELTDGVVKNNGTIVKENNHGHTLTKGQIVVLP